jgi:hypothetical protein
MGAMRMCDDFQEWHAGSVVVDQHLIALDDALCCILLHLDAFYQNMILVLFVVVKEQAAIKHDRVVLLSDLVCLRQVCVHVVLAIELDLWQNSTTER